MNINFLKTWRQRRAAKAKSKETLATLQLFSLVEQLFQSGQLSFDHKAHRLFITQPLAALLMARGADAWVQSVHNIYNYAYFLQTQQAWADHLQREELAAVRDAMQATKEHQPSDISPQTSSLSRSDIDRIRRTRRMELSQADMPEVRVEPFEFFIIPDSTEAQVEPLAVGYYDPNTGQMDVAPWGDVKQLLKDGHQ